MQISDFDYSFPQELLATHPPKIRGQSRLLVLERNNGAVYHRRYADLLSYVNDGDALVLNDTKVIKARLIAKNAQGNKRELLLIERHAADQDWHKHRCVYRGNIKVGEILSVGEANVTIQEIESEGICVVSSRHDLLELAETAGYVPLPPYMKRGATKEDVSRYQTVFAQEAGSVAAPTASLNFTQELKQRLENKGVKVVYLTLHVGLGTFLPIRTDEIEKHQMHSEYFQIPASTVEAIRDARASGHKITAVGTTVTRTLEYCTDKILNQKPQNLSGEADIFIYPGYKFQVVDQLLTNFHAPKSTVLMMAAAFAGWDNLKAAYEEAIKERYAFLSYGDSMLIV